MICGLKALSCAKPTWCSHALVSNTTPVTDLTPRAVLNDCILARRLSFSSPPTARLDSLENGGQLPLVALAAFSTFTAILAIFTLLALLALLALITLSETWLAPALALTLTFQIVFAIALAIALRGNDRRPSS